MGVCVASTIFRITIRRNFGIFPRSLKGLTFRIISRTFFNSLAFVWSGLRGWEGSATCHTFDVGRVEKQSRRGPSRVPDIQHSLLRGTFPQRQRRNLRKIRVRFFYHGQFYRQKKTVRRCYRGVKIKPYSCGKSYLVPQTNCSEKMIPVPHFFRLVAIRVTGDSGCVGV